MGMATGSYIGFFPRAGGYIIDAIILAIVNFIVSVILGVIHLGGIAGLVTLIISLGYFTYFWSTTGQTIGARVLGFKVVNEASGQPPTTSGAAVRWVGMLISFAVIFIGVLWVLWDPKRQGWLDKIAGTVVVPAQ